MIHLFNGGGRLLFFPKKWANSIVRWIAGIHSPSGTVRVHNDMNPSEGGSLALDVDVDAVSAQVLRRVDARNVTQAERDRFAHLLRGMVDECSVLLSSGHLYVSADWLEGAVKDIVSTISGGGSGSSEALTVSDIGTTVQAFSQKLSNLLSYLNSSGKVSITGLLGSSDQGTRLVKVNNSGGFGYSTADEYKALIRLAADYYNSTDDDYGFAFFGANATKENCLLVGTDANGKLKQAYAVPSSLTYDRVLVIKANSQGLSLVHQREVGRAVNPSSSVVSLTPSVNTSSADSNTWTAGGDNGVVVRKQTRTRWNGTTLYGFYRDFTYDKNGRLYSVSAETRYTIDTPTVATWS